MAAPMRHLLSRRPGYFVSKFAAICFTSPSVRRFHCSTCFLNAREFDPRTLDTIACPLSKNQLRYDADASELVNDELGVAYKISDGIPNLIPQDARMIREDKDSTPTDSKTKNNDQGN